MVTSQEWMASLAGSAPFADVMAAIRAEHGRGARAYLAAQAGVSRDTAGRWLSGKQRPSARSASRLGGVRSAAARRISVNRLRRIKRVNPGTMGVFSRSDGTPDGTRTIRNMLNVGPVMDRVADMYAAGNDREAAEMFDAAVIATYGGESATDTEGLAGVIGISEYDNGIEYE